MEFKYLKFIDLQGKIFSNVDDQTIEVELPSTFIIGRNIYNTSYVRFNLLCGIILDFNCLD